MESTIFVCFVFCLFLGILGKIIPSVPQNFLMNVKLNLLWSIFVQHLAELLVYSVCVCVCVLQQLFKTLNTQIKSAVKFSFGVFVDPNVNLLDYLWTE